MGHMRTRVRQSAAAFTSVLALTAALAGCGAGGSSSDEGGRTVTLVTHDAFAASKPVLRDFTRKTGYKLRILRGGDAGAAVNQAVLNKDNPQGDVFFGVDNTLLSRPLDQGVFDSYTAKGLKRVPTGLQLDRAKHRVTPIDSGQICVNYDRAYFARKHLAPPRTLTDLAEPAYKNLLTTENAATSSPGLGFLLASVQRTAGTKGGWQAWWKKLRANGVQVVDSWEQAYNDDFSGAGHSKGARPLVVSYASSPPSEVLGQKPLPKQAPTGIVKDTCFQQTEFAALLHGAQNPKGGRALIDYLLSRRFQQDMPLQMYVDPVIKGARLPQVFARYEDEAPHPITMDPARIAAHREQWIRSWNSLTVR